MEVRTIRSFIALALLYAMNVTRGGIKQQLAAARADVPEESKGATWLKRKYLDSSISASEFEVGAGPWQAQTLL